VLTIGQITLRRETPSGLDLNQGRGGLLGVFDLTRLQSAAASTALGNAPGLHVSARLRAGAKAVAGGAQAGPVRRDRGRRRGEAALEVLGTVRSGARTISSGRRVQKAAGGLGDAAAQGRERGGIGLPRLGENDEALRAGLLSLVPKTTPQPLRIPATSPTVLSISSG
jgi:hypothetical protein